jgi:NADPH:quinone reductase-like Zn-dependent oxidoreductase
VADSVSSNLTGRTRAAEVYRPATVVIVRGRPQRLCPEGFGAERFGAERLGPKRSAQTRGGTGVRAAVYDSYGDADVVDVREHADPPVGPDTVLVRTRATSVNPVDWKIRRGYLQGAYPHHLPIIPGWDVAGVVEAVGPAVITGLRVGDGVWGYVRRDDVQWGTAAELVPAPQRTVARKPASLSFEEAAAVPLAGLTAYQALVEALAVQAGERVLVHAAAGGVGHLAVQIAVARGCVVVGTASPDNHARLRELGVTEVVDYHRGTASEQLSARVDAVLDLVGGDALDDAPHQVTDPSRIVSVVDAQKVLELGGHYVFVRPEREHLDALAALVEEGKLRVELASVLPLERVADAHRLSESGHTHGKIVLTP